MQLRTNEFVISPSYKVIYEIEYKTIYFDELSSTFITIWNANSAKMTREEYMEDAEATVELIRSSEAKYMITDHRENKFHISDELQKWYADLIAFVLGNSGFEKCAVVITTDLNLLSALEEIRVNLAMAQGNNQIAYKFFGDMADAQKWIGSKA